MNKQDQTARRPIMPMQPTFGSVFSNLNVFKYIMDQMASTSALLERKQGFISGKPRRMIAGMRSKAILHGRKTFKVNGKLRHT